MGQAVSLYRKYRPQVFADVAGQESVTRGLLGSLKTGGISHAYLFTGPRGSGKTTTARLLAKAVNCRKPDGGEPCNACDLCVMANEGRFLDIVELDAASNRGIDEVRQLREQVAFAPSMGKYKTYILDEVHMLTKDAANAFLKTLEEPPPHVIFVLATTEAHKVLATIASRCQRYDFQRIPMAAARGRLEEVLKIEKIKGIGPDAIEEIVRRGDGSLRDMLGLLEQVLSMAKPPIGLDDVRRALGLAKAEQVERLATGLGSRDTALILSGLAELHEQGIEPHAILGQLTEHVRERLVALVGDAKPASGGFTTEKMIAVLSKLSSLAPAVRQALSPRLTLEIGLLDAAHAELLTGREELLARIDALSQAVAALQAGGGLPGSPVQVPSPGAERLGSWGSPSSRGTLGQLQPRPPDAPQGAGLAPAASSELFGAHPPAPPPIVEAPIRKPIAVPQPSEPYEGLPESAAMPAADEQPSAPDEAWGLVLEQIRRDKPQTAAFAREGRPLPLEGQKLRIVFSKDHSFHRGRLAEPDHNALLRSAVKEHYGPEVAVVLEEDAQSPGKEKAQDPPSGNWAKKAAEHDKTVQLIVETFSGEVVRLE